MQEQIDPSSAHQEFCRLRPGGGRLAVVFTHGIMGSPLQFGDLAASLGPDIDYVSLLLPGHGGSPADYARSGMTEWQAYVDKRVGELAGRYSKIILAGHSMGGLLSIRTALLHKDKVCGLFLLALPLSIGISRSFLSRSLAVAFGHPEQNSAAELARRTTSVTFTRWYDYLQGSTHVLDLLVKARTTRKLLPDLAIPLWAVQSGQDEIISRRAIDRLPDTPVTRRVLLEQSSHYQYPDADLKKLEQLFREFVDLTTKGE